MNGLARATGLASLLLAAMPAARAQEEARPPAPVAAAQAPAPASCVVCHPGAARGLRASAHASLEGNGCASCHGSLEEHARAAVERRRVEVPSVAAAACAQCHPGRDLEPARGAHGLAARGAAATSPLARRDEALQRELDRSEASPSMRWRGLVDLGYRFVDVDGSRDGYATDLDLHDGLRVRTAELAGTSGFVDELSIEGHDLGDPRRDVRAAVRDDGVGRLDADWQEGRYRYRGEGDYHRVDRNTQRVSTTFEIETGEGAAVFGSFSRFDDDGYWLTQRVGNQNLSVQAYVDGVSSPRHAIGTDSELGARLRTGVWTLRASGSWHEEEARDAWTYTQPATANPLFVESEEFVSRTTLRGPGGTATVRGDFDGAYVEFGARAIERERGLRAVGETQGYDVAEFTTDTIADGSGRARTFLFDLDAAVDVADDVRLRADLHARDHREDMSLLQTDTTVYPTLPSTVVVTTDVDQETRQRMVDGNLGLEWAATKRLDLGIGYGLAREHLRVPDVDPSDPDAYRRGTQRDHGGTADLNWRPSPGWNVRSSVRDYATDGALLHELTPERAREAKGSVGYSRDDVRASVFGRHRRNENSVAQHRLEAWSLGATLGGDLARGLSVDASYVFARTDVRTLTNFYFDPDPNPAPTLVGFHGDTDTLSSNVVLSPSTGVRWTFGGNWTSTRGDFDVRTFDWRLDLCLDLDGDRSAVGTEVRCSSYAAEGGTRDWDAQSWFVYWRQRF